MNFDREKLNFTSLKRQRCQVCRCEDKFNFNVSDKLWREIVPLEFQNKVVCLPCFDELAREKNKEYAHSIAVLYFAGRQASFKFQTVQAQSTGQQQD
ncbi:MAG TPA: hypothetical protein VLH17_09600 [Candidatus Binatia bacterium]|nr:hypothetical protein [Candidatus Binatia bacterium]